MKNNLNVNKITEGAIWKQILLFFFPLLFGAFFQQFYNTVDAIVVGRFVGKEALASVGGGAGTIINLFVGFFIGMSAGATVTISQYFGGNGKREVRQAIHTAIAFALCAGVLIMVMGFILAPDILIWMNTPDDILQSSVIYIRIYFCGMIANLIYNTGAGILRALGDSKRPLYFLMLSCLINVVFDLIFVIVLHQGVAGVAIATIIAQTVSALLVCLALARLDEEYRLRMKEVRIQGWVLKRIIRIGLPAGMQSLMYSFSNLIIQSNINDFGTDTVAAWTAYGKIDSLFWMTISSLGIAITTFTGQNYGAGFYSRVKSGVRQCLMIAIVITGFISITLVPSGEYLLTIFTKDSNVVEIGASIIRFMVPTYITYICIEIFSGALRGMGSSFVPMLMTCSGICILRIIWLITVVPRWHMLKTVILCYPITWIVTSILFIVYYQYFVKKNKIA